MRNSRQPTSDHRSSKAKRSVARAIQGIELLESRLLLTGSTSTNTLLTFSPSEPPNTTVGTAVTLTAVITGGTSGSPNDGTVTFKNDTTGTIIGTQTVIAGTASLTGVTTLPVGTDMYEADYSGDATTFAPSNQIQSYTIVSGSTGMTPSATSLMSSANPSTMGNSVTFTATVSTGATGTVDFSSNGTSIGSATINSGTGTAAVTTSSLPAGSDIIVASYEGDSNFTSSQAQITQTVNSGMLTATTTSLTTSNASVTTGTMVTFTATVKAGGSTATSAGGTVDFFDGSTDLSGALSLTNGVAAFMTNTLALGSHMISAVYSGDTTYATSTSANVTETITPTAGSSTTTLMASTTTPSFGSAVMLTANVLPTTATGTVTFFDGSTQIGSPAAVSTGVATISTSTLSIGMHSLTATYNGDTADTASTSSPITVTVGPATPGLAIKASSASISLGQSVTFTATLTKVGSGPVPTGTVDFLDGSTTLNSSPIAIVNGVATFSTTTLAIGTHNISFSYSGDSNYGTGTSATTAVAVGTAKSTVALTAAPSPGAYQQAVVLTATVTPGAATGTVDFFDGTTDISGPVAVTAGVATYTTSALTAGTHHLTAAYSGDTNYSPSTSPIFNETISTATTTITLMASSPTIVFGESLSLDATVPAGATGTVTFYDGAVNIGSASLIGTGASIIVTSLPVGTDSLTAVYNGSTNFAPATSAAVSEVVTQDPTTTTVTATPVSVAIGAPVTVNVSVVSAGPATSTPTGTVTILDGTTAIANSVPLINGVATYSTTALALGTNSLSAVYNGNTNFTTSTSSVTTVTATLASSSTSATTLTASATSINYGSIVTFTATVASALAGGITPNGTVTFFDSNNVQLGSPVTLVGGVATLSTASLPPGTDSVLATYSGDTQYTPSQSGEVTVAVAPTTGTYETSVSSSVPTTKFGNPVVLTAIVTPTTSDTPPAVSGIVTFFVGSQTLGAATLNGSNQAVFSTLLPAGSVSVTAVYQSGGPINALSLPTVVSVSSAATPSFAKAKVPAALLIGMPYHTNFPIIVTNLESKKLSGNFALDLYLNSKPTLNGSQMLLSDVHGNFAIGANRSHNFHMLDSMGGLTAGVYYLLANVTDPNGLTNLVASNPIIVASPFVSPAITAVVVTPSNIAVGGNSHVTVTVTNDGNETASGLLEITLKPANGNGVVVPGVTLATLTPSSPVTLAPGTSRKFHLPFSVAKLAQGKYTPSITVSLAGVTSTTVGSTAFVVGPLHNYIPPLP